MEGIFIALNENERRSRIQELMKRMGLEFEHVSCQSFLRDYVREGRLGSLGILTDNKEIAAYCKAQNFRGFTIYLANENEKDVRSSSPHFEVSEEDEVQFALMAFVEAKGGSTR